MIKIGDTFEITKSYVGEAYTKYSLFKVIKILDGDGGKNRYILEFSYDNQRDNQTTNQSYQSLILNFNQVNLIKVKTILPLP